MWAQVLGRPPLVLLVQPQHKVLAQQGDLRGRGRSAWARGRRGNIQPGGRPCLVHSGPVQVLQGADRVPGLQPLVLAALCVQPLVGLLPRRPVHCARCCLRQRRAWLGEATARQEEDSIPRRVSGSKKAVRGPVAVCCSSWAVLNICRWPCAHGPGLSLALTREIDAGSVQPSTGSPPWPQVRGSVPRGDPPALPAAAGRSGDPASLQQRAAASPEPVCQQKAAMHAARLYK